MNFYHKMYYQNLQWFAFNVNKLNCYHHLYKTFDIDAFQLVDDFTKKFKHISPFFKFGLRGFEQDLLYKADLFSEYFFEGEFYKTRYPENTIIIKNEIENLLNLDNLFYNFLKKKFKKETIYKKKNKKRRVTKTMNRNRIFL